MMDDHLKQFSQQELFTAIQVTIKSGDTMRTYTTGTRSSKPGSPAISASDLFDIGSITKSFTSVLAIKADSEGKLSLKKTVGDYLKQYPNWSNITLTGLLDMSTGIPNYSNTPTINYLFSQNLKRFWSTTQLIDLTYPKDSNPPRMPGFFYSNTGYVLLDMMLSEQYKTQYKRLLTDRLLKPLQLDNTFYPVPTYPNEILNRMVRGYAYNIYDNPELLGRDVTENNLSWAGAAGALVSNSEDVAHWVEELFIKDTLLTAAEKQTMQRMISLSTGQPIEQTSAEDPKAFALGISQAYDKDMGRYWFYEGQTLGYRAFYMYSPESKIIVVALFNSATNSENDKGGPLLKQLYLSVLAEQKKAQQG